MPQKRFLRRHVANYSDSICHAARDWLEKLSTNQTIRHKNFHILRDGYFLFPVCSAGRTFFRYIAYLSNKQAEKRSSCHTKQEFKVDLLVSCHFYVENLPRFLFTEVIKSMLATTPLPVCRCHLDTQTCVARPHVPSFPSRGSSLLGQCTCKAALASRLSEDPSSLCCQVHPEEFGLKGKSEIYRG